LLQEYLEIYSPDEHRRHRMRPGVTSWAAVNGRHSLPFKDRLRLDVWYVDNWSLRLDFRIMVLTIQQVLAQHDVATVQDDGANGFPLAALKVDALGDPASHGPEPEDGSNGIG
jgi:hypothetical protein